MHTRGYYSEIIKITRSHCENLIQHGRLKYDGFTVQVDNTKIAYYISLETFGLIPEGSCI